MKYFKLLIFTIFLANLYLGFDAIYSTYHEYKYGPYTEVNASVARFEAVCSGGYKHSSLEYKVTLNVGSELVDIKKPFIGVYPIGSCSPLGYFSLYDFSKIKNLKPSAKISLIVDSRGQYYIGRTGYFFSYSVFFLSLCLLFVVLKRYREIQMKNNVNLNH